MGTRGEARLQEITNAAIEVVSERGYYGMTIQEVADRVGISQAGLLKYVKNKQGLFRQALTYYDTSNEARAYIEQHTTHSESQQDQSPLLMPEYYRIIAKNSADHPQLTKLYLVLRAEATDPNHPAHEYYSKRGSRLRKEIIELPWKLPPEYDSPEKIATLTMCIGSAMEGLQLRWFGEPNIDFLAKWAEYEDILFPLPHWEGYR